MSHTSTSQVTHFDESCHTSEWVMSQIAAPALNVVLEDDMPSGASEEVLFLSMQNMTASVLSDGFTRQFTAQVLGFQLDNQVIYVYVYVYLHI